MCFPILQVGFSWLFRLRGNLKAECAVLPPSSRVAAIPLEAVAKATCCHHLTLAKIRFMINVLPVPPGASRKKRPPAFVSMLVMILL